MEQWALRADGTAFVITGPTGIGKTMLLKVFAIRIEGAHRSAYVPFPKLSAPDLCRWALSELGESPADDPESVLARVPTNPRSRGSTLLLLIDDAMSMPISTVEAMTELSRSSGHSIGLVLAMIGGPRAERVLSALGGEATIVSFDVPMNPSETAEFVQAELERAGVSPEVRACFDAAEIEALHERSAGVPARLNTEAGRMLGAIASEAQLSLRMPASEAGVSRPEPEPGPAGPAAPTVANEPVSPAPQGTEPPPAHGQRKRPLDVPPGLGWAVLGFVTGVAFTLGVIAFRGALVEPQRGEAPTQAAAQPEPEARGPR
jgi:type II secretory pathway predicted ATPase ExeA